LVRAYHHPAGIPQYTVGHPARVGTIAAASDRFGGLFFAGNHLSGIGVKDCVATGERIAADVRAWLEVTAPTEALE
jgi:oxygen-dependent protoporphyrinogen oxidase